MRSRQRKDGSWPDRSVNKERDPASFVGKLMSDAATAIATESPIEAGSRYGRPGGQPQPGAWLAPKRHQPGSR
jgi:hypothetical protein